MPRDKILVVDDSPTLLKLVELVLTRAGYDVATASDGLAGFAATVALVLGAAAVVALAQRRIGGFTGDVLGAAGLVGETVALVVAAAKW